MPILDRDKNKYHQQARSKLVQTSIPNKSDLKEGVPVISVTESGVFEYIKIKGNVYKVQYTAVT
tara:strand:- start:874 stop:1065 length:192 start_codon:yes stop_codon:yes gene_type:complete